MDEKGKKTLDEFFNDMYPRAFPIPVSQEHREGASWGCLQGYLYAISILSEKEKEIKSLTSELNKGLSPHENSDLEEMKIQSEQHSLAAKQAYINALEWTVKWREEKIKDFEQGIGEVLDGTLPYLAEQRLKKLIAKKGDA